MFSARTKLQLLLEYCPVYWPCKGRFTRKSAKSWAFLRKDSSLRALCLSFFFTIYISSTQLCFPKYVHRGFQLFSLRSMHANLCIMLSKYVFESNELFWWQIGSFGAITRILNIVPKREDLLKVALAGPLAGFSVGFLLYILGFILPPSDGIGVIVDASVFHESFLAGGLGKHNFSYTLDLN